MEFKDYILEEYSWPKIPDQEIERLAQVLYSHLRKMNIKMSKDERTDFVKKILKKQNGTCAFAEGDDRFCWNEPKDKELKYLKLQWGHKLPRSHGDEAHKLDNLILLCARCNNNIQKSRSVKQLIPELEHKLKVLKKLVD
tara:strand:+ start:101 stop:520 length:420 start_codon:yes stop_codon:yes gene_type:complete